MKSNGTLAKKTLIIGASYGLFLLLLHIVYIAVLAHDLHRPFGQTLYDFWHVFNDNFTYK